jgi:hypothetical protein
MNEHWKWCEVISTLHCFKIPLGSWKVILKLFYKLDKILLSKQKIVVIVQFNYSLQQLKNG